MYTFPSGTIIEFFSSDSPGKCQGSARDILFINEAFLVPYETARQLFVRTRQKIIVDWNPAASCWINEQIEPRPNCRTIHSTYKDNDTLSKEQIAELESNRKDENWARVFLDGLLGTLEGVIFSYEVIDKLPTEYKTV